MKPKKKKSYVVARNADEIAAAIGLTNESDIALMKLKADLSIMAEKAIARSGLSVNEIVERSGVARSKVSAIKNGAIVGMTCDLFLKVITAAGGKVTVKLAG